jgi:nitroimidazol reductase NimA-like FMN-containing flavoprotein (pyridoxamine 5'-phosphate oxidase superfamily)
MIGTLNQDEIDKVLRTHRIGRLACTVDDCPYIVPINYAYDGTFIYAFSGAGHKIDVMRRQPNVCFLVDEIDGPSTWKSVVAHGQYEEVVADRDRQAALSRLVHSGSGPVSRSPNGSNGVVVFRIRPREISGRFERQDA